MGQIVQKIICIPIILYQWLIRPWLRPSCRYYPSCSQYAITALTCHGPALGTWLAVKRLLRCHPWSSGGYDPVLPKEENP